MFEIKNLKIYFKVMFGRGEWGRKRKEEEKKEIKILHLVKMD